MNRPADSLSDLPPDVTRAVEALFERKAEDVALLDLRSVSTATDFFLIATGRSDTHVTAVAEHVGNEGCHAVRCPIPDRSSTLALRISRRSHEQTGEIGTFSLRCYMSSSIDAPRAL